VIAHGIFTPVADLARKLTRYIRHYKKVAEPIRWTYRDISRRITNDSAVTCHSTRRVEPPLRRRPNHCHPGHENRAARVDEKNLCPRCEGHPDEGTDKGVPA
jgi:hypothetical protein